MAKPFQETTLYFDSDLDAILNRVYGSSSDAARDRGPAAIPLPFVSHDQGSVELKQALAELRDRREKAQGAMRMKAEVQYLQEQIKILKNLGEEIDRLRRQVEAEAEEGWG